MLGVMSGALMHYILRGFMAFEAYQNFEYNHHFPTVIFSDNARLFLSGFCSAIMVLVAMGVWFRWVPKMNRKQHWTWALSQSFMWVLLALIIRYGQLWLGTYGYLAPSEEEGDWVLNMLSWLLPVAMVFIPVMTISHQFKAHRFQAIIFVFFATNWAVMAIVPLQIVDLDQVSEKSSNSASLFIHDQLERASTQYDIQFDDATLFSFFSNRSSKDHYINRELVKVLSSEELPTLDTLIMMQIHFYRYRPRQDYQSQFRFNHYFMRIKAQQYFETYEDGSDEKLEAAYLLLIAVACESRSLEALDLLNWESDTIEPLNIILPPTPPAPNVSFEDMIRADNHFNDLIIEARATVAQSDVKFRIPPYLLYLMEVDRVFL